MALVLALATDAGGEETTLRLVETSGTVLTIEDGILWRSSAGKSVRVGVTSVRSSGRILDLAADPAGLTFVAAENGLFVLGPRVGALDPVEAVGELPEGRPTSVEVDSTRRVWLGTERGLWVLDPTYFHARRRDPSTGGTGPFVVVRGRAGVCARAGGREAELEPPGSQPPRLTRVRIDGRALVHDAWLEREQGSTLLVEFEGEAGGGARFRGRRNGHHVWRPLSASDRLSLDQPGVQHLEFVAIDEELRLSEVFALHVAVPYPWYYSHGPVLAALVLGGFLVLAFFVWRERARRGRVRTGRVVLSAAVCVVFALQIAAGLEPHARGWPFVGFDMYTRSYARDDLVYEERIVMLRPDGSELPVLPQSAGVMVDEPWEVLRPMIARGEPALREYLERWRRRHPDTPVSGLQVQALRSRLTADGPVEVAPLIQAHYREHRGG